MARPKLGEEKNATATIAARITPELRQRVEAAAQGRLLTECFTEALENWCRLIERAAERKGRR